jgi:Ion channel
MIGRLPNLTWLLHNPHMDNPPRVLSLEYLRRTPSAGLLLVQLGGMLLYPWMEASPRGRGLLAAFGVFVLGVAVRVVRKSPWATWLGALLAALVVGLFVLEAVSSHPALPVAAAALEAAFYFYAAGSLTAYMMQDWVATTDELFAAGATFTLLVWGFAYAYLALEAVAPGSFSAPINPQGQRTWMELMFLSIAVLSGVGLSDILPVTPFARAVVMLEAFTGVMYLALVVSRLIALTMLSAKERK